NPSILTERRPCSARARGFLRAEKASVASLGQALTRQLSGLNPSPPRKPGPLLRLTHERRRMTAARQFKLSQAGTAPAWSCLACLDRHAAHWWPKAPRSLDGKSRLNLPTTWNSLETMDRGGQRRTTMEIVGMHKGRLEAFTDGVVAIIITIMVL